MAAMSGAPIQVIPAPQWIFPHAAQVFLIERYVHDLDGALTSAAAPHCEKAQPRHDFAYNPASSPASGT
jgi:hypothetical protein